MKDHIEDRNVVMQILLGIVTFGIYAIYRYHVTLKELRIANRKDEGAGLYPVLSLIPLVSLIAWWHYASELSDFTDEKYHVILTFLLWIFLSPIVWFLAQMELDKAAREARSASPGSGDLLRTNPQERRRDDGRLPRARRVGAGQRREDDGLLESSSPFGESGLSGVHYCMTFLAKPYLLRPHCQRRAVDVRLKTALPLLRRPIGQSPQLRGSGAGGHKRF